MQLDTLISADKNSLPELAKSLARDDIEMLAGLLSEKDDDLRYKALLLLQHRSAGTPDVYPYWDEFQKRLGSGNSYQRTIGALLIAENTKWDTENRIESCLDEYLNLLKDEKPITVRQTIQALKKIIPFKPPLCGRIAEALMSIDLSKIKETMRKLILFDIVCALQDVQQQAIVPGTEKYITDALTGGILDKKSVKLLTQENG